MTHFLSTASKVKRRFAFEEDRSHLRLKAARSLFASPNQNDLNNVIKESIRLFCIHSFHA